MNIPVQKIDYSPFPVFRPEDNPFESIIADVTHRCNMACANCYIPNRRIPDMDTSAFFDLLDRLPNRTTIRLMGAESTVREDFPDLVRGVRQRGHRALLVTNGLKLADFDYAKTLYEAGLRAVGISMNAADDDDGYEIIDNGRYAEEKYAALVNAFRLRMFVGTAMIVARSVNEHLVGRQIELYCRAAEQSNVHLDKVTPYRRIPMVLRFKSIGPVGRYMKDRSLSMNELVHTVTSQLGVPVKMVKESRVQSGLHLMKSADDRNMPSYAFPYKTRVGNIIVKIVNWSEGADGIIDPQNMNRGRITQDFMLAPAMEHIKENEFGY